MCGGPCAVPAFGDRVVAEAPMGVAASCRTAKPAPGVSEVQQGTPEGGTDDALA